MSFRQYGGINYAARNNIVKNNYTNANNLSVMTKIGQLDSVINVDSGLNMSSNLTFKQLGEPYYGVTFSDGTIQSTAIVTTDSYWQPYESCIYYTDRVVVGGNPYDTYDSIISTDVKLAVKGDIAFYGKIYTGYLTGTTGTSTFIVDGFTGNTGIKGTLDVSGNTHFYSELKVDGQTILNSTLGVNGATTLNAGLIVKSGGNTYMTVNNTGLTTLSNGLTVTGSNSNFYNGLTTWDVLTTLNAGLTVYGATTLNSTLVITGQTTLSDKLNFTSSDYTKRQIIGTTLYNLCSQTNVSLPVGNIYGDSTGSGYGITYDIPTESGLHVFSTRYNSASIVPLKITYNGLMINRQNNTSVTANCALDVSGNVIVTGATTLSSTLGVTGATTIGTTNSTATNLIVNGATTLSSTLDVSGNVTFSSDLRAKKKLYIGVNDPGGGDGDKAYLEYAAVIGEKTVLRIVVENDKYDGIGYEDHINLKPSGNVGIDTDSPAYKLDVKGTLGVSELTTLSNGLTVKSGNVKIGSTDESSNYKLDVAGTLGVNGDAKFNYNLDVSGATTLGNYTVDSTTVALTINGNTNIGGKITACHNSSSISQGAFTCGSSISNIDNGILLSTYGTKAEIKMNISSNIAHYSIQNDNGVFKIINSGTNSTPYTSATNTPMTIDSTGNATFNNGLTTWNYLTTLNAGLTVYKGLTLNDGDITFSNTTGNYTNTRQIVFNNANTDWAYIKFVSESSDNSYLELETKDDYVPIHFTVNGTAVSKYGRMTLNTNGLSINYDKSYTPSSYALDVNGTCSALSFNATSDYRIKENVLHLKNESSFTVDHLKPVIYTNKLSGKQDMGFIAHELQEHYPFLVTGEKDGAENQSVNYIGLIALLVKEIQELKQDIKLLKNI